MDLRKRESGILAPSVLVVINSVRNTYFVKEIFFQLFYFMDIILRLHMYPENMYSVPSLKMQKIRNPGKLKKKKKANPYLLNAFLSWVFQLLDTLSACIVTLICETNFPSSLVSSLVPKHLVRQ